MSLGLFLRGTVGASACSPGKMCSELCKSTSSASGSGHHPKGDQADRFSQGPGYPGVGVGVVGQGTIPIALGGGGEAGI